SPQSYRSDWLRSDKRICSAHCGSAFEWSLRYKLRDLRIRRNGRRARGGVHTGGIREIKRQRHGLIIGVRDREARIHAPADLGINAARCDETRGIHGGLAHENSILAKAEDRDARWHARARGLNARVPW